MKKLFGNTYHIKQKLCNKFNAIWSENYHAFLVKAQVYKKAQKFVDDEQYCGCCEYKAKEGAQFTNSYVRCDACPITEKFFYGFICFSGRNCTIGEPNPRTGRYSIAGDPKVFRTRKDRDDWVNRYISQQQERIAVTKRQLRYFCRGLSIEEFNEFVKELELAHLYKYKEELYKRRIKLLKNSGMSGKERLLDIKAKKYISAYQAASIALYNDFDCQILEGFSIVKEERYEDYGI